MSAEDATARPVLALESGPAAGVVAALEIARRLGYPNAIAFDMGGTTAKASLIEHGTVSRGREYEVGGIWIQLLEDPDADENPATVRFGVDDVVAQHTRIAALGIDIARLYTVVFALGAALAGLAGAMIGPIQSVQVGMGEPVLIMAFVVVVIGGIGSIHGALVGAILVDRERLILTVFRAPAHPGTGAALIRHALNSGPLQLIVTHGNPAQRLYERLGFVHTYEAYSVDLE